MARQITLKKKGDSTIVDVVDKGKSKSFASNKNRDLQETLNGVMIVSDPSEGVLNNFEIKLSELTNTFGATSPRELLEALAEQGLFKIGSGGGDIVPSVLYTSVDESIVISNNVIRSNVTSSKQEADVAIGLSLLSSNKPDTTIQFYFRPTKIGNLFISDTTTKETYLLSSSDYELNLKTAPLPASIKIITSQFPERFDKIILNYEHLASSLPQ